LNKQKDEKICLYIQPYVHTHVKNNDSLLYNTLNGEMSVYPDNTAIAGLLNRLQSRQNLHALIEDKTILHQTHLQEFFTTARDKQFIHWFDYTPENDSHKKPVAMPPILNFHRQRRRMAEDPERSQGQEILKYLHRLNLYINCYDSASYPQPLFLSGFRQFLFPYAAAEYRELDIAAVQTLLAQVKTLGLCVLTILGGNIFQYSRWPALIDLLQQVPLKKELGIFYTDITAEHLKQVDWHRLKELSFKVFVPPGWDKERLTQAMALLHHYHIDAQFQFTIQCESDAQDLGEIMTVIPPENLTVKAFYNGDNYDFFQENIFIQPSDFSETVVSKKDIFARSMMNPHAFGHMTILSTGQVYTHLNEEPIGTLAQEVKQLLLTELQQGKGWFRVRKELTPCHECIYQHICPPISNYEYALGRNDLCWRHQDTPGREETHD